MFRVFFGFTVVTLRASAVTIRDRRHHGTKDHRLELGLLGFSSQLSWALSSWVYATPTLKGSG